MNALPAASVIIPVLNGERTIGDLLMALKTQAGGGPFEIIVVDNGSTDRTMEIARLHGAKVLQQPVRGPSAARNLGVQHAQSDIIVHTDSDTVPTRRWLVSLISELAKPGTMIVTGPVLGWKPTTAAERFCSTRPAYTRSNTAEHPRYPYAVGMNLAIRKENLLAVGGWDEAMTSGEDVDLSWRLKHKFGCKIHFCEAATLFHQHRATDEALVRQARWHGAGQALFMRKHGATARWTMFHSILAHLTNGMLAAAVPLIWLGKKAGWISTERAEFEFYHRLWTRNFWGGFFEEWKKGRA